MNDAPEKIITPQLSRFHDWFEIAAYLGSAVTLLLAGPLALYFAFNILALKKIQQGRDSIARIIIVFCNVLPVVASVIYFSLQSQAMPGQWLGLIVLWTVTGILGLATLRRR